MAGSPGQVLEEKDMPKGSPVSAVLSHVMPDEVPQPDFTAEEDKYISALKIRLTRAKEMRDRRYDEWDGLDYVAMYEANEKLANSYINPKQNKAQDSNMISGTVRQKLLAVLAALNSLNLEAVISAFDLDNMPVEDLSHGLNLIRERTEEMEGDEEKRLMREYELLKHGDVFVEENWIERWRVHKEVESPFDGKKSSFRFTPSMRKTVDGPERNILWGPNVYLGDIKQPDIKKQPYIYTLDRMPYEDAKTIYGEWEMWKYVPKRIRQFLPDWVRNTMYSGNWRLTNNLQVNEVEIVKYQDKWNNEFQVIISGIPMLPIGFPLTEISPDGDYTITQQGYELIHSKFAYHKSLCARLRVQTSILDELLRVAVLLLQKKADPAISNMTNRVVQKSAFFPGKVNMGINADLLKPMLPMESQMPIKDIIEGIKLIMENIDQNSVNPTFTGQKDTGSTTATEILELQRQAKLVLGLTIFASSMLEKKLGYMRFANIFKNWFSPIDDVLDEARGQLTNVYRVATMSKELPGGGSGSISVIPHEDQRMFPQHGSEDHIDVSEQIFNQEEYENPEAQPRERRKRKSPIRKIFINAPSLQDMLRNGKILWKVDVNPTETRSSERSKLLFSEELGQALQFFGPDVNRQHAEERWAEVWGENANKFFQRQQVVPGGGVLPPGTLQGGPGGPGAGIGRKASPGAPQGANPGGPAAPTPTNAAFVANQSVAAAAP